MNEIAIVMDDADKLLLGNELTRLFALQDMRLSDEKKSIFIEELALQGIPVEALIEGLRSLAREELRTIKLNTIIDSAHRQVPQDETISQCEFCFNGEIVMWDDKRQEFALACTCPRGRRIKGLATWNGEENFYRRGRWLTLVKKIPMEVPSVSD